MPFEMTTLVARTPTPMTAPIGQELVILGLASNHYIALDETGRRIWDHLAEPVTVAELCGRLGAQFQGRPEQIASDLLAFLHDLEQEGLVDARDPQPS